MLIGYSSGANICLNTYCPQIVDETFKMFILSQKWKFCFKLSIFEYDKIHPFVINPENNQEKQTETLPKF